MEKGPRRTFGEKIDVLLEKPAARYAAVLLASGLLHGGQILHREIGEALDEQANNVTDLIRDVRKEVRMRAQEKPPISQEVVDRIKEGVRPDIDLSDTYFATEAILAGISDSDIAKGKERYDEVVAEAKVLRESGAESNEVMGYVLKQQGKYREDEALLSDLLLRGEGNCEARMKFITAVTEDVYPEWSDNHELAVQVFGSYVDSNGKEQPGHVRAVLDKGTDIIVLEGDAVSFEKRTSESAPIYDAKWLAMASYLAGQGALSYDEVGLEHKSKGSSIRSNSVLSFPSSPTKYIGGTGNGDISSEKVGGSWAATSRPEIYTKVVDIGVLSDDDVARHAAERKVYEEGELAEKIAFFAEIAKRAITSTGWSGGGKIDLSKAASEMPMSYEEIQKYIAYVNEDNEDVYGYEMRQDQKLPPGAEKLLGTAQVLSIVDMPTLDTLPQLVRFEEIVISAWDRAPLLLAQNHTSRWKYVRLDLREIGTMMHLETVKNIPTDELLINRPSNDNKKTIRVAGLENSVPIDECFMDSRIFSGVALKYLSIAHCLPEGDIVANQLESFSVMYFGPKNEVPKIRLREDSHLHDIDITMPQGVLPKTWLNPAEGHKKLSANITIAEIETGALDELEFYRLHIKTLANKVNGVVRRDHVTLSETYSANHIRLDSHILRGAEIDLLELDLADADWEIAHDAFDDAVISGKVMLTYSKRDDLARIKSIRFPPGTHVEYLELFY